MDIRPYMDMEFHVTVWFGGRCKSCHALVKKKVHDYGKLKYRELERHMDETSHQIEKLFCKKCELEFLPETIIYRDEIRDLVMTENQIGYGGIIQGEEQEKALLEAHKQRFDHFREYEEEFWAGYIDYALLHWTELVNELAEFEIRDGLEEMGIDIQGMTKSRMRKVLSTQLRTPAERERFWREANRYFIYDHLLDLGPLGWNPELDVRDFGKLRVRYAVLHFPMDERIEFLRTEWIGKIIKKGQGDNDFLFRRIAGLTEELERLRLRFTRQTHRLEELKAENTRLEQKLHEAYEEIRRLRNEKHVIERDPADVAKIRELKSFVQELIAELKERERELREIRPETESAELETLEEGDTESTPVQEDPLLVLAGKTVAIIGGERREQAKREYPCSILTHSGYRSDPAFYEVIKRADFIIVLTRFISHAVMWETKAYAIEHDKPIFFRRELNIPNLLKSISRELSKKP